MGQEHCSAPVLIYPVPGHPEDFPCLAWLPPVAAVLCFLPQPGEGNDQPLHAGSAIPTPISFSHAMLGLCYPVKREQPCQGQRGTNTCWEQAFLFRQTAWTRNSLALSTTSLLKQYLRTGDGLDSTSSCIPGAGAWHAEQAAWVPAAGTAGRFLLDAA